jgi:hypothetical protein
MTMVTVDALMTTAVVDTTIAAAAATTYPIQMLLMPIHTELILNHQ